MFFKCILIVLILISKSSTQKEGSNLVSPADLTVVSRGEWSAKPPSEPLTKLPVPSHYVIIHHTVTIDCDSKTKCSEIARKIQDFHMESRKWWDIGYNFLIGGDGNVYEGRGWQLQGAHTLTYNEKSVGVAFIGNFQQAKPPKKQLEACKKLMENGLKNGFLAKDYKVVGARQISNTLSPGDALFEDMKLNWEHYWSKDLS